MNIILLRRVITRFSFRWIFVETVMNIVFLRRVTKHVQSRFVYTKHIYFEVYVYKVPLRDVCDVKSRG